MKLNLSANLVLNRVCYVLYFPKCFQPITIVVMGIVAINVLEPSAFNVEFLYFVPLFNRISWLCGQRPRRDETSNGGWNYGPIWHDFQDNSNIYFIFCTTDSSQNVKSDSILKLVVRWKPKQYSLNCFHQIVFTSNEKFQSGSLNSWHLWFSLVIFPWKSSWKSALVFSQWVKTTQH